MSKPVMLRDEVYKRLESKTNKLGGRNPKKVGFSDVIESALDDQDRLKKKKIGK